MSVNLQQTVLETAQTLETPTLSELINHLVEERGIKFSDATRAVYVEYKKGTLQLSEHNPPATLARYVFDVENLWFWAVTALIALTAAVAFSVEGSALLYVRYALAGVFVLFLPGYMLVSALYPGGELEGLEKAALSIGVSLAIVPLLGLALNYTPWGLGLEPMVVSMVLLTEALAVACMVRRFSYRRISLG